MTLYKKSMKQYSTLVAIRDLQTEITLICHYKPIWMTKFKKTMSSIGENEKHWNFIHCLLKCKIV